MLFSHRAPDGDTMPVNHRATNDVSDYTLLQLTNLVAPVFARLDVVNAHAHIDPEFDRFYVAGNMDLGAESDGVHVANEEMMVTFGPFREVLPAGLFTCEGDRENRTCLFNGDPGGITKMLITIQGRFIQFWLTAEGLDLRGIDLGRPVTFSLQIKNNLGVTATHVDSVP